MKATRCKKGHVFDETNTYTNPKSGKRCCRICHSAYMKLWYLKDTEKKRQRNRENARKWRASPNGKLAYATNSESRKEYLKSWRKSNYLTKLKPRVLWIMSYLKSKRVACQQCGESHEACLDFHHRDPKTKLFQLTAQKIGNRSQRSIDAEIAKCDVLCSNCHRKHHYNLRKMELSNAA